MCVYFSIYATKPKILQLPLNKNLSHILPTNGAFILLAEHPHSRGAFIANGVIAIAH